MPVETATGIYLIDAALKGQQWQRVKGELRALVALQGAYSARLEPDTEERWNSLDKLVEGFIKAVEDDGLAE